MIDPTFRSDSLRNFIFVALCFLSLTGLVHASPSTEPARANAPASSGQQAEVISLDLDRAISIVGAGVAGSQQRCSCYGATVTLKHAQCPGPNGTTITKTGRCYAKKSLEDGKPCVAVCDSDFSICTGSLAPGCQ